MWIQWTNLLDLSCVFRMLAHLANMTPAPGLGSGNTAFRAPYPTGLGDSLDSYFSATVFSSQLCHILNSAFTGSQAAQSAQSPYGPPRSGAGSRGSFLFPSQQLDDPQRQSRTALQQQQAMQNIQQLPLNQHSQSGSTSSSSLPLQSTSQVSSQTNPG